MRKFIDEIYRMVCRVKQSIKSGIKFYKKRDVKMYVGMLSMLSIILTGIAVLSKRDLKIYIKIFPIFSVMITAITSCNKHDVDARPIANMQLVNAWVGGTTVQLNTYKTFVNKYASGAFSFLPGQQPFLIRSSVDTSTLLYNDVKMLKTGGTYTHFVFGKTGSVENIFLEEQLPPLYTDSVVGVRFINLSPSELSFNITLASNTSKQLFNNIAYKNMTVFQTLALPRIIPTGTTTFQIRNAATDALLFSYTMPTTYSTKTSVHKSRFRNITYVLKGIKGATGVDSLGILAVPHY